MDKHHERNVATNTLEQSQQNKVHFAQTLIDIRVEQDGEAYCLFSDGAKAGPFDLVIGCDGIKSAVKEYVDRGFISTDSSRREGDATGLYSGIRIRYAVQLNAAPKSPSTPAVTFSQYFGDGCYCLDGTYGAASSITKSVFAIYLDENYFGPFRKSSSTVSRNSQSDENGDWSQDKVQTEKRARDGMIRQLQEANIAEADLVSTIEQANRFFELGVYAHNPFCSWSAKIPGADGAYVVLCGDAAHALPPFLGQGSNQAIQDAYSLAKEIKRYNDAVDQQQQGVDLSTYLKSYAASRWMPNFQIFWKASLLGYLETGGFAGFFSAFRNAFFKTMVLLGVAQRVLLSAATPKV